MIKNMYPFLRGASKTLLFRPLQTLIVAGLLLLGSVIHATTTTGNLHVNGTVYLSNQLSLSCPPGTTMPDCMQVDNNGQVFASAGVAFNAGFDGRIAVTGTGQFIFLNNVTNAAVTGASDVGHIARSAIKNGNVAFNFPVGDGLRLGTVGISAPAAASDAVKATFVYDNPITLFGSTKAIDIAAVSPNQFWELVGVGNVETGSVSSNPTVSATLTWSGTNILPATMPYANVVVTGWDGAQWQNLGRANRTGNQTAGSVTTLAPITLNTYSALALALAEPSQSDSTLTVTTNNQMANGSSQDIVEVTLLDTNSQPLTDTLVTFSVGAGATLASATCTTDAAGSCTVGVTSIIAGGHNVNVTTPVALGPVVVNFAAGAPSIATSTLAVTTDNQLADGLAQDVVTVTLRDASSNPIGSEVVTLTVGALK